jgi:hypothetical protein
LFETVAYITHGCQRRISFHHAAHLLYFDKKSHIWQVHHWYSLGVKKIVAHIQRTVTISTISTTLDVSVSEDAANTLAVPPRDPTFVSTNPEGEKGAQFKAIPVRSNSTRRKPARRVRSGRRSEHKPRPGNSRSSRSG